MTHKITVASKIRGVIIERKSSRSPFVEPPGPDDTPSIQDVSVAYAWTSVKRTTFLMVGPLGILACGLALLAQWHSMDGLDRYALPGLSAVLLLLTLLLAVRRIKVAFATLTSFLATTAYFLLALNHQFAWFVPKYQMLSENTYWFSVLYATAFIAFRTRHAFRICAVIFGLACVICGYHLLHLRTERLLNDRMLASTLQFLFSSAVLVLAQYAVGRLRHQLDQVKVAAYLDVLTGLPNRRYAQQLLERSMAQHRPFALVMLDLDHFKAVNDTFGHQAGDLVLRETSRIISRHLSGSQQMVRWGGEEFVLILPGLKKHEGKALAETARADLNAHVFDEVGRISASFGVAEYLAGERLDTLMARADAALYAAKRQGRNGVRVAMDDGRLTRMDLVPPETTPADGPVSAVIPPPDTPPDQQRSR
ncbi:GGDEF domain-containing protein [Deinococcus ruber]|uniref:GGDEF domain-containing protein n=1 Tax=Deinococcus ruber TaxID=1848197 RepID=UPI001667C542|nr:GGDEF domain-containing protein [Deinococcus ruber]